ncbi:MAG: response regulator [Cyclobacteriaceae bacterium]|nr:response regulator [Cyclobacteriaceae bacterium]
MENELRNILIIDDNEVDQFITRSVIELSGCEASIHKVTSVNEALSFLSEADQGAKPIPGLILLDIHMPVLNGWNFMLEYEKLNEELKNKIVLIMFSSSISQNDRKQVKEFSDISEFIEKPLMVEKFQEMVTKHFANPVSV